MGISRDKHTRNQYFDSEGMDTVSVLMTMRLESTALQGASECLFQQKNYEDAVTKAELCIDILTHIIELDTATFATHTKTVSECESDEKIEVVWYKQMICYEIVCFSLFHLALNEKSLLMLNEAFKFSKEYMIQCGVSDVTYACVSTSVCGGSSAPVAPKPIRPLKRNRLLLKLYLLKNQVMLVLGKHSHTSHVEELNEVWREIVYCGDSFVTHSEYFEAGKLYKLAGEYFMSQSGRSAFNLNDKVHQMLSSESAQSANELNVLSAKYTKKYTYHLVSEVEAGGSKLSTGQLEKLSAMIHRQFISCIRVLFLQGICADSISQAQRHFEAAHSMREDYDRYVCCECIVCMFLHYTSLYHNIVHD